MKNQYFGDARDYFKYELLGSLMAARAQIDQLTCIWMLTHPTTRREGNKQFLPDPQLPQLTAFFRSRLDKGLRDIREMRSYFAEQRYRYFPYRDAPPYFSMTNRCEYFSEVPDAALVRSLVFFDPDVGMEPGRLSEKHLAFHELDQIFRKMDHNSVAVVYQHLRRVADCWDVIAGQVHSALNARVSYVAEGDLSFLVIPRNGDLVDLFKALTPLTQHHTPGRRVSRRLGIAE